MRTCSLVSVDSKSAPGSGHITEIDSFRAWAILSVVLFHYFKEFFPGRGFLLQFGWSGVDLFFVISGFVMYLQLCRRYVSEGRRQVKSYLVNRFLRIAPAFYVSLIAEVVFLHRDRLFSREFFMHLGFLQIFGYDVAFSIQPVYWSLAVEMHFYLFLILFAGPLTGQRAVVFISVLYVTSLLYRAVVSGIWGFSETGVLLINQLPGRLPQFITGMALAYLYRSGALWQAPLKLRLYLLVAGVTLYLVCGLWWLDRGDALFDNVMAGTVFHPILGLAYGLVMVSLMDLKGRFAKVTTIKPIVFVGLISYSLYLWHFFVLELVSSWGVKQSGIPPGAVMTSALLVACALSVLSYYGVEKQFLRFKVR